MEAWSRWRGLVSEQQTSGLSVTAFCRERGLRVPQMFAWRRRLRKAESADFVEVQVLDMNKPAEEMAMSNKAIEVRLSCERRLMVEPGFDADHLRALILALESMPVEELVRWA